jgi:hypothetical protein
MKQHPPRQIFEKLVNKNAIKRKIGGPPLAIFPETLDPPLGILAKTSRTPSPGFSTRVHLCFKSKIRELEFGNKGNINNFSHYR